MEEKPKFNFEKLRIWNDAMSLGERIHERTKRFPNREQYNLTSQICRAIDSVALNISEGSIVQSKKEFRRFLGYSARSLAEVVTCLHKSNRRNYLSKVEFEELYGASFKLMNMIIAFRNTL